MEPDFPNFKVFTALKGTVAQTICLNESGGLD